MKKQLFLFVCSLVFLLSAHGQQMIFAYGASCFVPVDKFNMYCNVPGGMIGRTTCSDAEGHKMHGGQFVITKREMDNLVRKECQGHKCNIRHIELALGIICDSTVKGPWEGVGLVRVDIPEINYLPSGISWPTVKDCGSDNPCFRPGEPHKTSGGYVEGFMKPVSTARCTYNINDLYSGN